jgi:DNA-binding SARP family transcriptional activator/DNA-binding beta-propeller fold protein YncE
MEFRILGPLEVLDGGRIVSLGGGRQRALLALFVLHRNEVMSVDRLINELWGEQQPETAANVVQVYVSRLRKALQPGENGEGALGTRGSGYVLRIDDSAVDVDRFERLTSEGRDALSGADPARASALLTEALSLWRGDPLSDFAFESFAQTAITRLAELKLAALEDRIDADLARGRHRIVTAELETLATEHPLRERLRAQLMLALYRSGRQADALRVYGETRRTLVDELGIEPGPDLKTLEQAILDHDDTLTWKAPAPEASAERATVDEGGVQQLPPRRRWPAVRTAIPIAMVLVSAMAVGGIFALHGGRPAPRTLAPNSVGFIDARSGRVTRTVSVGRKPVALAMGFDSLWVAEYADQTVSRINAATGQSLAHIPVGGHPIGVTAYHGGIWVWTEEHTLVAIDPRYDSISEKIPVVVRRLGGALTADNMQNARRRLGGEIIGTGGYLWVTVPETTLVQVDPDSPRRSQVITPDDGAQGPIVAGAGVIWVGGFKYVTPFDVRTGVAESPIAVGRVRALSFAFGTLWVASGLEGGQQDVRTALRQLDLRSQLPQSALQVGSNPTAVAAAADSLWVASENDGAIMRVDPRTQKVVATLRVGPTPTYLLPDRDGLWVAVD